MDNVKKLTNQLNELLTKNYDAEAGYKKAADLVEGSQLKTYFQSQAKNRYDFGHALKSEIKGIGGEVDKGTSLKGDAHRTWMSIKDTFSATDNKAMLEEVVRGEEAAVEEYQEILKEATLAPTTQKLIKNQVTSIQEALANARSLDAWAEK
ncbi:MAG: ferritin-like domain-containing protein [Patiriisocius sp.]|uniref:ferritin-like domain-containing protein n=1 Tax=Patiriisocius sp. TaxID=2822396 RepID=UPI003EF111DA